MQQHWVTMKSNLLAYIDHWKVYRNGQPTEMKMQQIFLHGVKLYLRNTEIRLGNTLYLSNGRIVIYAHRSSPILCMQPWVLTSATLRRLLMHFYFKLISIGNVGDRLFDIPHWQKRIIFKSVAFSFRFQMNEVSICQDCKGSSLIQNLKLQVAEDISVNCKFYFWQMFNM